MNLQLVVFMETHAIWKGNLWAQQWACRIRGLRNASLHKWMSTHVLTGLFHVLLHRRLCHIAQKKADWPESKMLSRNFPHPIIGKNPWERKCPCDTIPKQQASITRKGANSGDSGFPGGQLMLAATRHSRAPQAVSLTVTSLVLTDSQHYTNLWEPRWFLTNWS